MKHIITFILLSLYLSTITAQLPSLLGNWTTGWETDTSSCCVPSEITIIQINNIYQASFVFPSNYTSINTYCISNNIAGNFIENFTLSGNYSVPIGYATAENFTMWNNTNSTINITTGSYTSSLGTSLGPFSGVFLDGCDYTIISSNSSSASQEAFVSDFTGNYVTISSIQGFNGTSNQTVNTCCTPSSVSIEFINDLPYFNLTATFSQESLSNAWCIGGNITNASVTNQYYGIYEYTSNSTFWVSSNPFQILMNTNTPGYIQGNYYGISDSMCSFNMNISLIPPPTPPTPNNTLPANLTGNWIPGWQTNTSTCCVPTSITILQSPTANAYQVAFFFPSNYVNSNSYCNNDNIQGSFIEDFSYYGSESEMEDAANLNFNFWADSESDIIIMNTIISTSVLPPIGPFVEIYLKGGDCSYSIIPSGSSYASQETYISNFTGNYTTVVSVQGFNSTSNSTTNSTSNSSQIVNTCCTPSSVSIQFINNTSNFNLTATYSQESLSNAWCISGGVTNSIETNQIYTAAFFNANSTLWTSSSNDDYVLIMNTSYPGYIQGFYNDDANNTCTFNMSLTNFGGKLASSIFGIIALLIISLW